MGAKWLQNALEHFRVQDCMIDSWAHAYSTIMPFKTGLVIPNASRVHKDKVPKYMKVGIRFGTQKICVGQLFRGLWPRKCVDWNECVKHRSMY